MTILSSRRIAALTGVAALALSLTACGEDQVENTNDQLVIGVSGTEPNVAMENSDGSFSGFDVDLAAYLAKGLGWNDRDVVFTAVSPTERETALANGDVDMVVSTYAINEERDAAVDFAGPYYIAGQDLLVAQDSRITGPSSLSGQTVCGVADTQELARLKQESPGAGVRTEADIAACVDLLLAGQVAAVTTDDLILAGYAEDHSDALKVVGAPFSTEYYGVGLPEGSPDVAAVNELLVRAINDGTWQRDFDRHLGSSGYTPALPPAPGTQTF